MDVELAALLERAAVTGYGQAAAALLAGPPARSFGVLEVEDCPPQIPGEITSRLCFKLAKHLVDTGVVSPEELGGPAKVAEQLLNVLVSQGAGEWFALELGGSGHINATPTPKFLERWTGRVLADNPLSLLHSGSFVCVPGPARERLELHSDPKQLLERLKARTDPDAKALFERCAGSGFRHFSERLMVLGVLGDAELDAGPFLSGLNGRQNVPWFLDRFRADSIQYQGTFRSGAEEPTGSPPAILAPGLVLLRRYRRSLLLADLHQRPERFFAHLLAIVRDFYRIYNQPQFRLPLRERLDASDAVWLHAWVRAVISVTEAGIALC